MRARALACVVLAILTAAAPATAQRSSHRRSGSATHADRAPKAKAYRAPQARTFAPKVKTYHTPKVKAYHAPRVSTYRPAKIGTSRPRVPRSYSAVGARDAGGRITRRQSARREFMRATGYPKGRPGYVVDHVVPLACGGADAPGNMQWQTVAEATAKDRTERRYCERR